MKLFSMFDQVNQLTVDVKTKDIRAYLHYILKLLHTYHFLDHVHPQNIEKKLESKNVKIELHTAASNSISPSVTRNIKYRALWKQNMS